nr:myosin-11-like isoform X4 [Ipomoea batatas]
MHLSTLFSLLAIHLNLVCLAKNSVLLYEASYGNYVIPMHSYQHHQSQNFLLEHQYPKVLVSASDLEHLMAVVVCSGAPVPLPASTGAPVPWMGSTGAPVPLVASTGALVPLASSTGALVPLASSTGALVPLVASTGALVPLVASNTAPVP